MSRGPPPRGEAAEPAHMPAHPCACSQVPPTIAHPCSAQHELHWHCRLGLELLSPPSLLPHPPRSQASALDQEGWRWRQAEALKVEGGCDQGWPWLPRDLGHLFPLYLHLFLQSGSHLRNFSGYHCLPSADREPGEKTPEQKALCTCCPHCPQRMQATLGLGTTGLFPERSLALRFAFLFTPCNLAEALRAQHPPSQTHASAVGTTAELLGAQPCGCASWSHLWPLRALSSAARNIPVPILSTLLRSSSQTAVRGSSHPFPRWSGSCRPGSQGRPSVSLDGTSHPTPPPCREPGPHWFS